VKARSSTYRSKTADEAAACLCGAAWTHPYVVARGAALLAPPELPLAAANLAAAGVEGGHGL